LLKFRTLKELGCSRSHFSNLRLKGKTLEFSLRSPFDLMVNLQDHSGWLAFLNTVRTERFDDIMCLTSRIRAFPAA